MISSLVRWLGRWVVRATGQSLAVPPREPSAEDNVGAGI
jgi:hypothetical protein